MVNGNQIKNKIKAAVQFPLLSVLAILLISSLGFAQSADVIKASGGTNISIDSVTTQGFSPIDGPTIRETQSGQLAQNGTIVLTLPAGYIWNTNLTINDITLTIEPTGAANTKLQASFTEFTSNTEVVFTIDTESSTRGNGQGPGRIEIQGLELRPTTTDVPSEGQISNTGSTGPAGATNYGNLSTAVGSATDVRVENAADGTGQVVQSQDIIAGNSLTVYAIARDMGGNFIENLALEDESDWTLLGGDGNIPQSALSPSSDLRRATFSSQLTGTARIQANYSGITSVSSDLITVLPRPAESMSINTQPSDTVTAGQTFPQQPVIFLRDQFGNKVTTDNSTEVTVSLNSGNADLGPQTRQATNGEITFSNLNSSIADTITLKFESSELPTITSDEIVVLPDIASDLEYIQQPTNTAGNSKTVTPPIQLQLLDQYGNKVAVSDTTVTITDEEFIKTNSSTLAVLTNNDGIATFDEIVISTNNTDRQVQLTSQFTGISQSVTSNDFLITSSTALSKYEITTSSGDPIGEQQAGTSFDISVTALNGNGNEFTFSSDQTITITADNTILNGSFDLVIPANSSSADTSITLTSTGDTKIYAAKNQDISGESNSFNVIPSDVIDATQSTITADPTSMTADGSSTSQITVQLKDEFGNNLVTGGENVELQTTAGQITGTSQTVGPNTPITAIDNEDGTYTATLTSSTTSGETAIVEGIVNGNDLADDASIEFTPGSVSSFIITLPSPNIQTAGEPFNIDINAVDTQGNIVDNFNGSATISSNNTFSSTATNVTFSNGTITDHPVTLTRADSSTSITVTADDLYNVSSISNTFIVLPNDPDPSASTVTTVPDVIQNDNTSTSVISVILRDQFGNRVYQSNTVSLNLEQLEENNTTTGNINPDASLLHNGNDIPFNNNQGVYRDTLIASNTIELIEVTGEFGSGSTPINQTATIDIVVPNTWTANAGGPSGNRTDWTNPENWSQGTVPGPSDFVIIPDVGDDLPILDLNIDIGSFEIQENVSLTLFGGNAITVSGNTNINGTLNIEDNTELAVGGSLIGSGVFTAGESTNIEVGGDLNLDSFLAGSDGSIITFNGSDQQVITSPNILAHQLHIENNVIATSGGLIDTSELLITEGNTFELAQDAGITLDNLENISGEGQFILNNNTLVVRGDLNLLNIDTSEGTVVFGIRTDEDFANYPDLEQQQIANLSQMQNATINNTEGVRTFEDIIVDGDLTLENGELIISSGKSLIAPNQTYNNGAITFRRSIRNKGWTMLGSPVNSSFSDLTAPLTTQGMANSDYPSKQPNLLYYYENAECTNSQGDPVPCTDNQRWRTPDDVTNSVQSSNTDSLGRGYFFYVFGDVDGDTDYNDSLPVTLTVTGEEYQYQNSNFTFSSVTYTASADTIDSMIGWNLVANPWGATIDWDDINWTKTNIDNVVYAWDPSTNSYKTWNGIDGSLNNGLITPFQAFWVKANGADPVLTMDKSAKTTGGEFYGKSKKEPASIGFKLEADTLETETHITLTPDGSNAKDPRDAYRLLPFETDTYLEFFTTFDDGTELAINNLARSFGKEISIPLHVGGFKDGELIDGEYTLSWPTFGDVPDEWSIILKDKKTGENINLRKNTFYSFNLSQSKAKSPLNNTAENFQLVRNQRPDTKTKSQNKSSSDNNRFVIRISPGADGADVPDEYSLGKNYPNPFSEQTTIEYNTPVEGEVQIHIYDILGRKVKTILDERQPADYHDIKWSPTQMASGVYIVVMHAGGKQFSKKLTYIK